MKFAVTTLVAVALLTAVNTAGAIDVFAVDGDWSNPVGGSSINYVDGVFVPYGNNAEDQIWWGTGYQSNNQSGLGFTGSAGPQFTVIEGTPFPAWATRALQQFSREWNADYCCGSHSLRKFREPVVQSLVHDDASGG